MRVSHKCQDNFKFKNIYFCFRKLATADTVPRQRRNSIRSKYSRIEKMHLSEVNRRWLYQFTPPHVSLGSAHFDEDVCNHDWSLL
jgi:hypothetical protein